jgi:hypothetical protein
MKDQVHTLWVSLGYSETEVQTDYANNPMRLSAIGTNADDEPVVDQIQPIEKGGTNAYENSVLCSRKTFVSRSGSYPTWLVNGEHFSPKRDDDGKRMNIVAVSKQEVVYKNPRIDNAQDSLINPAPCNSLDLPLATTEKGYLSESGLIESMVRDKHIIANTIKDGVLREIPYADLITAYSPLYSSGKDEKTRKKIYLQSIDFSSYLKCQKVNQEISQVFYLLIGCLERRISAFLCRYFGQKCHEENNDACDCSAKIRCYIDGGQFAGLDPCQINYETFPKYLKAKSEKEKEAAKKAASRYNEKRKKAFENLASLCSPDDDASEPLLTNAYAKRSFAPIFLAIPFLSFGEKITLFSTLPTDSKKEFLYEYTKKIPNNNVLVVIASFESRLIKINHLRNKISHFEQLLPWFLSDDQRYDGSLLTAIKELKSNFLASSFAIPLPKIEEFVWPDNQASSIAFQRLDSFLRPIRAISEHLASQ